MRRWRAELIAILLMVAAFVGLLGTVVVLVDQEAAAGAVDNARVSVLAESTLSASAAARNAASFAVVLVAENSTPSVVSESQRHLDEAISLLESRYQDLTRAGAPAESQRIDPAYQSFLDELDHLRTALAGQDLDSALSALTRASEAYQDLSAVIGDVRDVRSADSLAAGEEVGRAATLVRVLTIFVIPFALLLLFWRRMRRSTMESMLEAELAHEKEISRSKDRFIADISHELRTPLTGIYGFASAIEELETSLSPQGEEMLDLIIKEASELTRMVDDLVTAGRLDADAITYKIERVELDFEIEAVISPFLRKNLAVEFQETGLTVRADRLRLRQVLRNLVSNAAKYGDGEIAIMGYSSGDRVTIEVLDNGPGVAPEIEERLFERYVHEPGRALLEGSVGLGLAIASSLTEGMAGSLDYARVDDITAFSVTLPSARDGAHGSRRVPAPSLSYSGGFSDNGGESGAGDSLSARR